MTAANPRFWDFFYAKSVFGIAIAVVVVL